MLSASGGAKANAASYEARTPAKSSDSVVLDARLLARDAASLFSEVDSASPTDRIRAFSEVTPGFYYRELLFSVVGVEAADSETDARSLRPRQALLPA
jgi:hypothetical protein